MSDQVKPNRGGRPCIPPPPTNSAETRALIAREIVKTNPSEHRLRHLYRLLKAYVTAEVQAAADAKTQALVEQNRLKTAELELKRADYRLRFAQKPLGVRNLLTEAERLKSRIAELERASQSSVSVIDCGVMQKTDKSSESGSYAI